MSNIMASPDHLLLWKRLFCLIISALCASSALAAPRYVIVTDMTHDDGNSLIRLLYYANEIDIEAIIIAPQRPDYSWDSDKPWKKGQRILGAYEQVYERLKQYDSRYPKPNTLMKITRRGHGGLPIMWHSKGEAVDDWIGEGNNPNGQDKDSEGSDFLIEVFERSDERPIYVGLWGAPVVFSQALYRLRSKHEDDRLREIMDRLYVYSIHVQDISMDYFMDLDRWNADRLHVREKDTMSWKPWTGRRLDIGPNRLMIDMSHFWSYIGHSKKIVDQVHGHGPLSELYDSGGEGDTPAYLALISGNLGLNDPWRIGLSSWGNRFRPDRGEGNAHGANVWSTNGLPSENLNRWVDDVQASFMARLKRTITPPLAVNHEPIPRLNGDDSNRIVLIEAWLGHGIVLDASGSVDPDGHELSFRWWVDKTPGTYQGEVKMEGERSERLELVAPKDLRNKELHIILEVRDNSEPALVAYRRAVLVARLAR